MFSKLLKKALNVTDDNRAEIEYMVADQVAYTLISNYLRTVKPVVTTLCDNWWISAVQQDCMEVLEFLGLTHSVYLVRDIMYTIKSFSEKYVKDYPNRQ